MFATPLFSTILWFAFGFACLTMLGEYLAYSQTRQEHYRYPGVVNAMRSARKALVVCWCLAAPEVLFSYPMQALPALFIGLLCCFVLGGVMTGNPVYSVPPSFWATRVTGFSLVALAVLPFLTSSSLVATLGAPWLAGFGVSAFLFMLASAINSSRELELYRQG